MSQEASNTQTSAVASESQSEKATEVKAEAISTDSSDVKVQPDGKVQMLTPSAFKRLKEQARAKGAKEALAEQAKKYGFGSTELYIKAVEDTFKSPGPKATNNTVNTKEPVLQDPGPAPEGMNTKATQAWNKERNRIINELERTKREKSHYEKKYRNTRQMYDNDQTKWLLEKSAMQVGIRDPEYAVRLLEQAVAGKDENDLKSFDERKYFEGLRGSHPYLFGEVVKPATTGTAGGATPAPVKQAPPSSNGSSDAMKLDPNEWHAMLRRRGWNLNGG